MARLNRTSSRSTMRLIGGSSHPELTELIAKKIGVRTGRVVLGKFANNETNVQLQEQVRGQDVYLIQTGETVIFTWHCHEEQIQIPVIMILSYDHTSLSWGIYTDISDHDPKLWSYLIVMMNKNRYQWSVIMIILHCHVLFSIRIGTVMNYDYCDEANNILIKSFMISDQELLTLTMPSWSCSSWSTPASLPLQRPSQWSLPTFLTPRCLENPPLVMLNRIIPRVTRSPPCAPPSPPSW